MRRPIAVASLVVGVLLLSLETIAFFSIGTMAQRVSSGWVLVLGVCFVGAGAMGLRPSQPLSTLPRGTPAPYTTAHVEEGKAPAIPVQGLALWQWSPQNPLGGSSLWSRNFTPMRWQESGLSTKRELRYHVADEVRESELRRAAKKACRAAEAALVHRGSVRAHGEARTEGSGITLVLHLTVTEPGAEELREASVTAFDAEFRRVLRITA